MLSVNLENKNSHNYNNNNNMEKRNSKQNFQRPVLTSAGNSWNLSSILHHSLENLMQSYQRKTVFRNPMVDSDEEIEKQLSEAIRTHRRNTKSQNNPFSSTINKTKILNEGNNNLKVEMKNVKPDSPSHKSVNDYVKQGAIPKNLNHKNKELPKDLDKPLNISEKVNYHVSDQRRGRKYFQHKNRNFKESNQKSQKKADIFSKPFFYVVPKNPAPNFFLPEGSYYVLPKELDPSLLLNVVVHPENVTPFENPRQKEDTNNLGEITPPKIEKLIDEDLLSPDLNMNIQPLSKIKNFLSEDNFNLTKNEKENRDRIKLALLDKIQHLQTVLGNLHSVESSLNIASNSKPSKNLYEKNLGIKMLDVKKKEKKTAEGCSEEKTEEHQGIGHELEVIENTSKEPSVNDNDLLMSRSKSSNCDDTSLRQKRIERDNGDDFESLSNSSECADAKANTISPEFSNEASAANIEIQTQLQRMTEALPESNFNELFLKCLELEGNEELVTEYIQEVTKRNEMSEKISNLLSVIPNVDIEFIQKEIQKGDTDLDELILSALETGNYPKSVESEESKRNKRLWNIYVENFSVPEFLRRVPDFQRFLDNNDDNLSDDLVYKFLQSRFPNQSILELQTSYKANNLNLVTTCSHFEKQVEPISLANSNFKNENFDEIFLQQICYIDHRREITDYLEEIRQRKILEKEEARLANAFLVCPLCTDDEVIPSEVVACSEGHVFCKTCITRYVEVALGDGEYKFMCPSPNCPAPFPLSTLKELLSTSVFTKILKRQQFEEIKEANIDGLESCRFCEFAYIPDSDDKIFKCQNPDCLAEICRNCGELNHIPKRCEEIERPKDVEARKKVEEAMTNKLLRLCPTCNKKFVKIDGCNKITCVCGTNICYICREKIDDYSHFQDPSIPSSSSLCPLYSLNDDLHIRDVLSEGIETQRTIFEGDPDVRIMTPLLNLNNN